MPRLAARRYGEAGAARRFGPAAELPTSSFASRSSKPRSCLLGVGFRSTFRISGAIHGLSARCVRFTPEVAFRCATLAFGWGSLCRAGFGPAGSPANGFRFEPTTFAASPFPRLSWRTCHAVAVRHTVLRTSSAATGAPLRLRDAGPACSLHQGR